MSSFNSEKTRLINFLSYNELTLRQDITLKCFINNHTKGNLNNFIIDSKKILSHYCFRSIRG
jgi:hypothetical protein